MDEKIQRKWRKKCELDKENFLNIRIKIIKVKNDETELLNQYNE